MVSVKAAPFKTKRHALDVLEELALIAGNCGTQKELDWLRDATAHLYKRYAELDEACGLTDLDGSYLLAYEAIFIEQAEYLTEGKDIHHGYTG